MKLDEELADDAHVDEKSILILRELGMSKCGFDVEEWRFERSRRLLAERCAQPVEKRMLIGRHIVACFERAHAHSCGAWFEIASRFWASSSYL